MNEPKDRLAELANQPVGQDLIQRAREISAGVPELEAMVDGQLAKHPTRGEMHQFLPVLKAEADSRRLNGAIRSICRLAQIESPSGGERLVAMQIALLQEQNQMLMHSLTKLVNQGLAKEDLLKSDGFMTSLLGGLIFGAVLTR